MPGRRILGNSPEGQRLGGAQTPEKNPWEQAICSRSGNNFPEPGRVDEEFAKDWAQGGQKNLCSFVFCWTLCFTPEGMGQKVSWLVGQVTEQMDH